MTSPIAMAVSAIDWQEVWELDDLMLEQATKRSPIHYPYTLEIA